MNQEHRKYTNKFSLSFFEEWGWHELRTRCFHMLLQQIHSSPVRVAYFGYEVDFCCSSMCLMSFSLQSFPSTYDWLCYSNDIGDSQTAFWKFEKIMKSSNFREAVDLCLSNLFPNEIDNILNHMLKTILNICYYFWMIRMWKMYTCIDCENKLYKSEIWVWVNWTMHLIWKRSKKWNRRVRIQEKWNHYLVE